MKVFLFFMLLFLSLKAAEKPNVLLISIDDLNDWVGYMKGHPQAITPNMDKLAKRGVAFLDAHCTSPLCNPSRSSLLSGLREEKTGVYNNSQKFNLKKFTLLPQYFAENGYITYGSGKIHHQKVNKVFFQNAINPEQRWSPFQQSKSVQYTKSELAGKGSANPVHIIKDGPGGKEYILPFNRMASDRSPDSTSGESFDWHAFELEDKDFGDGMVTDWTIEQLKKHDPKKPFFLGLGFYRPHIPLYAPRKYFDMHPLDKVQLPEHREDDIDDLSPAAKKWALEAVTAGLHSSVLKHDEWKKAAQAYLACVTFIDTQIGKVLDFLDKSPYADNTIIVLFSDHGWHLGEKQHWGKWTGWNDSTSVPFIIVPAGAKESKNCSQPVSLLDIYPTLIDMAGLPHKELDGVSLKKQLIKPELKTERVVRTLFDKGNKALISTDWRYIRYSDGSEELYNRLKDPHEFENLFNKPEYKEALEKMRSAKFQ